MLICDCFAVRICRFRPLRPTSGVRTQRGTRQPIKRSVLARSCATPAKTCSTQARGKQCSSCVTPAPQTVLGGCCPCAGLHAPALSLEPRFAVAVDVAFAGVLSRLVLAGSIATSRRSENDRVKHGLAGAGPDQAFLEHPNQGAIRDMATVTQPGEMLEAQAVEQLELIYSSLKLNICSISNTRTFSSVRNGGRPRRS